MSIKEYGFIPTMIHEDTNGIPARIIAVHRQKFEIVCDKGQGFAQIKSGEFYLGEQDYPTVGDFVMIDWQEYNESRIIKTLPRKTLFSRRDPSNGQREQVVAANFDYVFIMQSLNHDFNPSRLERYLTLGWQSGAIPIVVLTKADMISDYSSHLRMAEKLAVGTCVIAISTVTGLGIEQLSDYLKPGKTITFLGSSGVGKSTLLNYLAGETIMMTSNIREKDERGKHTTTHRQLVLLNNGVMIIDTPGMRELGMWNVSDGIGQSFADVEQYFGHCKFKNCHHQSEPGCAIKKAIQSGELSRERFESYLKIDTEARYSDDKVGYLQEKEQWHKEISKFIKQRKVVQYQHTPCIESFTCAVCGHQVVPEDAGTGHRNHCPKCLSSIHVDKKPGDRASLCKGIMDPIGVWVRKNGEWAIVHRCRICGELSSNRIAADDNMTLLMSIAVKPLASPPIPLWKIEEDI
ncbi:MAG: ribosome small subunit-dependent GTPase A [Coprobacillus sp.]